MPGHVFAVAVVVVVAVLLGRLLSRRGGVPEAAAYVLLGIAAGLIPGIASNVLTPDVVLLVFLPALIYYAGFYSDPRETMAHVVPIVGQSVVLVLATAAAAAAVVQALLPGVGWAAGLAFGAAVAPPDPVAATNVVQRLGAPRRLVTVLEGEGLINDGVALTLFALAVGHVGTPPTAGGVISSTALEIGGGIGIGIVVGVAATRLRARIRDTTSQVVLSLATPYVAFVPADLVHASGVLATVTAAVWLATRGRGLFAPTARLQTETFWRVLNVLLVAVLFVLLGLEVPAIVAAVSEYSVGMLALASAAVVAVVVLVRMVWVLAVPPALARLRLREESLVSMPRRERLALGWCGPRGPVSLAVALSLPMTVAGGAPFPHRDLLVFLTIVVVLATLVGQVVPLPAVLRMLKLRPSESEQQEGLHARRAAVDAALAELDTLAGDGRAGSRAEELRQVYELRRDGLAARLDGDAETPTDTRSLRLHLMGVERRRVRDLHRAGEISAHALRDVSQELDMEETRLRGPH